MNKTNEFIKKLKSTFKSAYLKADDTVADLKFFLKKTVFGVNEEDKIKHAFHEVKYCNEKIKLSNDPNFAKQECQKAYNDIKSLLPKEIKSLMPQNYNEKFFQILEKLYKACIENTRHRNEKECMKALNEMTSTMSEDYYYNPLHKFD